MNLPALAVSIISAVMLAACGGATPAASEAEAPAAAPAAVAEAAPEAVKGWREFPLRDGVVALQARKWRTDTIDVPVKAGEGLEYKVEMSKGEGLVYNVSYVGLDHPGMMEVEFHGHTPQVDGVGDLMFYSKTGGTPESGVFTAPWTGIHGWYLKNDSGKDVVAKLELAGFYDLHAN
jgi:hypothetical protein